MPPSDEPAQDVPRARDLILRYGWNAACYQILNPGIAHYFSPRHEAVVGYVPARTGPVSFRSRVRLVAGAPVCQENKLPAVVDEWEADARQNGTRVCYFGAAGRLMTVLGNRPNYSTVLLGAQPMWNPHNFTQIVARRASLRAQIRRAQNKGIVVHEWHKDRATNNPALLSCLHEWLANRSLPALRFLVEPDTLGRLFDRRVFVAERSGAPVAWAVASPIPARNGWLVEQIVRGANAPNGCAEFLIAELMAALADSGAAYVTLGLVPLSHHVSLKDWGGNPPWLQLVLRHVRAHGKRFYNFNGLDRFRRKWSRSRGSRFTPSQTNPASRRKPCGRLPTLFRTAPRFGRSAKASDKPSSRKPNGSFTLRRDNDKWCWPIGVHPLSKRAALSKTPSRRSEKAGTAKPCERAVDGFVFVTVGRDLVAGGIKRGQNAGQHAAAKQRNDKQ